MDDVHAMSLKCIVSHMDDVHVISLKMYRVEYGRCACNEFENVSCRIWTMLLLHDKCTLDFSYDEFRPRK